MHKNLYAELLAVAFLNAPCVSLFCRVVSLHWVRKLPQG